MMKWEKLLSIRRLGQDVPEPESPLRTSFQKDYDRIVFSSAFRRLQDKTQVFPLSESDYVRTRLTHSLESSCVGRSLGEIIGCHLAEKHDVDISPAEVGSITAAACLAHDIGNPPFGHTGEDAIRHWFRNTEKGLLILDRIKDERSRRDLSNFEGNAQGFRVLVRLQSPDNHGGMRLTCATLASFTKYPKSSYSAAGEVDDGGGKFGFMADDADFFKEVAEEVGLIKKECCELAWNRHPLAYLVEAADDICYHVVDLEDGHSLNHLGYDEVEKLLLAICGEEDTIKRLEGIRRNKERIGYLRAKAIGKLVESAAGCFIDNEDAILEGRFSSSLTREFELSDQFKKLKQTASEKVYKTRKVVEVEAAGFSVFGKLLEVFTDAVEDYYVNEGWSGMTPINRTMLRLLPDQYLPNPAAGKNGLYSRVLNVVDFVSGMTDSYAVSMFKKITGISLP